MSTFRLNIVFSGVDFDDDEVFETLAEPSNIVWRSQGCYAFATAIVEAPSAFKAADLVTQQVTRLVPSARPIRLDDDLVSIPDVAGRVGVTREAVRNWANGARHANFPMPRGVVGDGIKVWAWADVSLWLQENLGLGDSEQFPSAHDAVLINALFSDAAHRHFVSEPAPATWNVIAESVQTSADVRLPRNPGRQATWVSTAHEQVRLVVTDGGLRVAA
jgi:hypothetical protein